MSPVKVLTATSDPMDASTRLDFARLLRALMQERRRSADSVARRSRYAGMPISRATVYNLIAAEGVPRRETVLGFLRGCGLPAQEQIRWLVTFDRLYPAGRRAAS
ncbi:helix-turn-helix domain-containing protein [Actinoplanes sp. TBRC 11911]|uniref:helix-turn-helix domain-containing protein n=1 Tax=Actinoplanes sp. TBRC 11911 TaxID=2729386 RepID=UPI00145D1BF2|nr:helix-turn-helix domain-containing protein [Actinoplanes sp. TBRC 11911]NMO49625.1 helix-turn-helix domain-containing protein [Actinoplanes sp. TBRC 11911]